MDPRLLQLFGLYTRLDQPVPNRDFPEVGSRPDFRLFCPWPGASDADTSEGVTFVAFRGKRKPRFRFPSLVKG